MKTVWGWITGALGFLRRGLISIVGFLGEAVSQAFVVLFFSFVPFAALAFGQVGRTPGFKETFLQFFSQGQVAFLTFGIVGNVIWAVSTRNMSGFFKTLGVLCGVGVLWFSASALSSARTQGITPDQNFWLWAMYLFIVSIWFCSMLSRKTPKKNSAQQADDLIKRASE